MNKEEALKKLAATRVALGRVNRKRIKKLKKNKHISYFTLNKQLLDQEDKIEDQLAKELMEDINQGKSITSNYFQLLGVDCEAEQIAEIFKNYYEVTEKRYIARMRELPNIPSHLTLLCLGQFICIGEFKRDFDWLRSLREKEEIETDSFDVITKRVFHKDTEPQRLRYKKKSNKKKK